MLRKRYSVEEIATKLREAQAFLAQGKRQQDVARELGISVMTFHRWRRAYGEHGPAGLESTVDVAKADAERTAQEARRQRIEEMQLENSRLRRLVTDLLLEKIKLEEAASNPVVRGAATRHASH